MPWGKISYSRSRFNDKTIKTPLNPINWQAFYCLLVKFYYHKTSLQICRTLWIRLCIFIARLKKFNCWNYCNRALEPLPDELHLCKSILVTTLFRMNTSAQISHGPDFLFLIAPLNALLYQYKQFKGIYLNFWLVLRTFTLFYKKKKLTEADPEVQQNTWRRVINKAFNWNNIILLC